MPGRRCNLCGRQGLISQRLGLCLQCICEREKEAANLVRRAHAHARAPFGLPEEVPRAPDGLTCTGCGNRCRIPPGSRGYCGLRRNEKGLLHQMAGTPGGALVSWYHDPLPTNCVASWVCPAGTDVGYPKFSYAPGPEYGYSNLAVFYEACSFDCLFCQNWHFREAEPTSGLHTAQELAAAVDRRTACICYFGGDPGPQVAHALAAARIALRATKGRPLRICWETNGCLTHAALRRMAALSLRSGGCIKVDLKAFTPQLHRALCGTDNAPTLASVAWLAEAAKQRPSPPLLVVSTLLVPGYVEAEEVRRIARFIASLDPATPYSLLAFYPQFLMNDLPVTSREHAFACLEAAQEQGLRRVHLGNRHLLGV
ncbi:MAG: radical SAM protein [candidate division KSB1 bacterium]|nr:radical SAM protein [candidate division KSB1 bacterium]MDZ7295278.1 radical SAM protein [candidate division KSB1 bacterium]MDZ7386890.1 radical SAM protein [candidate division KSB1 bacterium]MDZ7393692.1 radical SAM protein [candidate division KSB1 bacterium]